MFKHYLARIEGVEIYPIISLIIFFAFFLGLLLWVHYRADKKYVSTMSNLPLDLDLDDESNNTN